jgi:hypothetical protein
METWATTRLAGREFHVQAAPASAEVPAYAEAAAGKSEGKLRGGAGRPRGGCEIAM